MDEDLAVLLRDGEGGLAFQIEVLLPADAERALDLAGLKASAASMSPRSKQ